MVDVSEEDKVATITVRLIRSFEHRNIKHIVFKHVSLDQTVEKFMETVLTDIKKRPGIPPPLRTFEYDAMKIQHKAHGYKTSNPVINTGDDEKLMLKPNCTLFDAGIENETEISFFKMADYKKYQANPVLKW